MNRPLARPHGEAGAARIVLLVVAGSALLLLVGLIAAPMIIIGGSSMLFAGGGAGCGKSVAQPGVSGVGKNSIPANFLMWYQRVGTQYNVPWTILAGIGTEESANGTSNLPGVHSGDNGFGAAGPMQIGIGGKSTNNWGGAPIHPASEVVNGVATDENGDGTASVYDPADAIAGAAKYLLQHGVQSDPSAAIFAYDHAQFYVTAVEHFASQYASGGFTVSAVTGSGCTPSHNVLTSVGAPNAAVLQAIAFASEQLGKPYLFGGTGPDAFDCSGLMMMAYRAAGIDIPRTSQAQWTWGPRVAPSAVEPGDLVFFAGADGTPTAPGHVGLVISKGVMIEAYATGFPIRVSTFGKPNSPGGDQTVVGFTRPWRHPGVTLVG